MTEFLSLQNEIINDFSLLENWEDKYQYIVDCGKKLPAYPNRSKNDEKRINECQSETWMDFKFEENKIFYFADSNSEFVKGLIYLLFKVYSGQRKSYIIKTEPFFLKETEIIKYLSPLRQKGINAFVKRIKRYAEEIIDEN